MLASVSMQGGTTPAAVLLVDDHELRRLGAAEVLRADGHAVRAIDWATAIRIATDEAPVFAEDRDRSDIVLGVLRADRRTWDRHHALAEIGDVFRIAPTARRTVAIDAGDTPIHPVVALRFANTGFQELAPEHDLRTRDGLRTLIDGRAGPCRPTVRELARFGYGPSCAPERVVDFVARFAEQRPATFTAFEPGLTQQGTGLSRRQIHTLRRHVCSLGDLAPGGPTLGGPHRDRSLARWSRVVEFVNLCRDRDVDAAGLLLEAAVG